MLKLLLDLILTSSKPTLSQLLLMPKHLLIKCIYIINLDLSNDSSIENS